MFRKILFPTDFSEGAYRAIEGFARENEMEVGELIVLHVIDQDILEEMMNGYSLAYCCEEEELKDIEKKLNERAWKKLNEKLEYLRGILKAKEIRGLVKLGVPWREIVKTSEEEDVSLILLPSHGKLGFSREIMGSTTLRVLRKTDKPVLIIKTHEEGRS
ncbi:universal stress protein [Palaeococcus ferrophilus]|uniref:universal stress protein n=1 Tax=Palaeococcus ferrophilus TaxID=83868 RepID=UPI00064E30BC|nr:universal stress protein [Palaeococcus ferrophilus]